MYKFYFYNKKQLPYLKRMRHNLNALHELKQIFGREIMQNFR